ncbi:MAG: type II toxin-antitoxin system RelE/ParE family toxin [Porticoccaceae bacterium]
MLKIHKRALAENDLIDVWTYSLSLWGMAQADSYLDDIDKALLTLAEQPLIGIAGDHIRSSYRRFPVRKRQIYYLVEGEVLHVIRVLGGEMLPERHL